MSSISFPLRLTFTPTFHYVTNVESTTAACPGTFSNPQATSGQLCMYEKGRENLKSPVNLEGGLYSSDLTSGIAFEFELENEAQDAWGYGSWAVAAP